MDQFPRGPLMAQRFLMGVFGVVFTGVGLTLLTFMWIGSDDFGSEAVFFKIFASFIAIAFVAFGGTMALSAWRSNGLLGGVDKIFQAAQARAAGASPDATGGYACPSCGAALAESAEVSPLGDVKCTFCGRWFNVHKAT